MEEVLLADVDVNRLRENVNQYIEDEIDEIEVSSINEMKETFKLFKAAIIDTRS